MSWSDFFLPSTAQTSSEQADHYARQQAEYQAALERRRQEGTLPDTYTPAAGGELESQDAAAWEGAKEGAAEGFGNVIAAPGKAVGFLGDTAGSLLGGVIKNVPWWAWLAAAGALFFWMGGLVLLRGRLAK